MFFTLFIQYIFSLKETLKDNDQWIVNNQDFHIKETIYTKRIYGLANLTFSKCIFNSIRNRELLGGAIYVNFSNKIDFINSFKECNFINCLSRSGGAIYIKSDMPKRTNNTFQSCSFENNVALNDGGAIYAYFTICIINDSNFTNNQINCENPDSVSDLTIRGGAIFNEFPSFYTNCRFINNSIFVHQKTLIDHLSLHGGAFCGCYNHIGYDQDLINCYFSNNSIFTFETYTINGYIYCHGSALCLKSRHLIDNCVFNNNSMISIAKSKMKLFTYGTVDLSSLRTNINNTLFINNSAFINNSIGYPENWGAAIHCIFDEVNLTNCTFIQNLIYIISKNNLILKGEAFYSDRSKVELNKCKFINHSLIKGSISLSSSRIIYLYSSSCFLKNCILSNNSFYIDDNDYTNYCTIESYNSNLSCNECFFINSNYFNTLEIYYSAYGSMNVTNSLFITNCIFKKGIVNVNKKRSLLYILHSNYIELEFIFENNQIYSENLLFFNIFENNNKIYGIVRKNCISPYNEHFYDNSICNLYNKINLKQISFYDAFSHDCLELPPSSEFSQSHTFSASCFFTKSKSFSDSNYFTKSTSLSFSYYFTKSKSFFDSNYFTKSKSFFDSNYFTKSASFSDSCFLTKLKSFADSNYFTKSASFSFSYYFTKSKSFVDSHLLTIESKTFNGSCYFSKSNKSSELTDIFSSIIFNNSSRSSFFSSKISNNEYSIAIMISESYYYSNVFSSNKITKQMSILKTSEIIGIVIGIVAFFTIIIVVMIYKKMKKKQILMDQNFSTNEFSDDLLFGL